MTGGGDALVLMPTGGGKSLCYQIPSMLRPGVGVVVSPLIALMQDQVAGLLELGVGAAMLNSSQDAEAKRSTWRRMESGEVRLLYVSPERLLVEGFLDELRRFGLNGAAIDRTGSPASGVPASAAVTVSVCTRLM